ncbi:MAG: inorganic diphosphatase [Candidatus Dormibacteraceae bacterium]
MAAQEPIPLEFDVVVEVPQGSRNKYEMDHATGRIYLDRELFTATHYPVDYGFIPRTLSEDGDPLDALVVVGAPTFPGCHIRCRAVGVFRMRDEGGVDAKVLAVPSRDPRVRWRDLEDVPEHVLLEIRHFFDIYKDLEPGKHSEVLGWEARAAAESEIRHSIARHA